MRMETIPLSPLEVASLPSRMPSHAGVRRDTQAWLSEVRACRCSIDRTSFALLRHDAERPVIGYLLGFERHGHAVCTRLAVDAAAAHVGSFLLIRAFMDRLVALAVPVADFRLAAEDVAAHTLLRELGARTLDAAHIAEFADLPRSVLQLDLDKTRFQPLSLVGRSDVPASFPSAPTPMDIGFGPRRGEPSLRRP